MSQQRIYLAGPMAHYKHYNFPAFDAARDLLYNRHGMDTITVVSPADLDRNHGFDETQGDPNNIPPHVIHEAMRRDIKELLTCDKVVVLDKWEHSKGACLEVAIAKAIGLPVETLEGTPVDQALWYVMEDAKVEPCSQQSIAHVLQSVFGECKELLKAGQQEYAHNDYASDTNAFRNFEHIGQQLGLPPEKVLLVYLLKHLDGIIAWTDGLKQQRDNIEGRINDAIVYLCLLRGMITLR